jgi:endonuclease G, mitochondrial
VKYLAFIFTFIAMRKIILILFLFSSLQGVYSQNNEVYLLPFSNKNGKVIKHTYYYFEYNEQHEQASWVYYRLTNEFVSGPAERKNNFKADPLVKSNSAQLIDYKGSGYDRGHLCPAGSMKINQLAMDESFYMSNITPQLPGFNRGKWKQLEGQVRKWLQQEDTLHVVTGPVLSNSLGSIGVNKVTIPSYYYKVIYDPTGDQKMIAFLMPHQKIENHLSNYQVSVDKLEEITGIDFFKELHNVMEEKLEGELIEWEYPK